MYFPATLYLFIYIACFYKNVIYMKHDLKKCYCPFKNPILLFPFRLNQNNVKLHIKTMNLK